MPARRTLSLALGVPSAPGRFTRILWILCLPFPSHSPRTTLAWGSHGGALRSQRLLWFPVVAGGFDALVVRIQLRLEQNQRGQAAGDVGDFAGLIGGYRAAQQTVLAVAQPFLQHLVAADGVIPDLLRHVLPIGGVVEVNVVRGLTQQT